MQAAVSSNVKWHCCHGEPIFAKPYKKSIPDFLKKIQQKQKKKETFDFFPSGTNVEVFRNILEIKASFKTCCTHAILSLQLSGEHRTPP